MLSNSASTIQTRRQAREASLEVLHQPTPLPGPTSPQRLEKHQSTTLSPTFGQLSTEEQEPRQLDTNIGQHPQHIMQGAQQHSAAQPGYQYIIQQQPIDPRMNPQMIKMMQEQAARQAMNHMQHMQQYQNNQTLNNMSAGTSPILATSPVIDGMQAMAMTTPMLMQGEGSPTGAYLPSPPPTQKTGGRVIRHAVDAAPMPIQFNRIPVLQQPLMTDMALFPDMAQQGGSSPYQGSMVDPTSPHLSPELRGMQQMPAMYPDGSMMPHPALVMQQHHQRQMMMAQAAAEGRLYYPDSPMHAPLSPREAMLAGLEIDATIEETGISAEDVSAYISEQDPVDSRWTCLFEECGKKFGRKENIRSHVQTHLGDRQFRCNHCGKCFVRQHDLKRHAKIHSGSKPHKCPCGNGFARQDALTRHRQRGVCSGALPGFERREVKRGRPRKNRPELEKRLDKASRSRALDAMRGSEDEYASSSSPSDSGDSDPYTPPHLSDADQFVDLSTDAGVDAFIKAYQNTPPTSPYSHDTQASRPQSHQQMGDVHFQSSGASNHSSPLDHFPPPADHTSPTAVSPKQLHSPQPSPVMLHIQSTPHIDGGVRTAQTSPALTMTSTAAPSATSAAQPERPFSQTLFDWGVIEAQPGLLGGAEDGAFSPACASSPAHSDLMLFSGGAGEDMGDVFAVPRSELYTPSYAKGMDLLVSDGAGFFDFSAGSADVEGWLLSH